MRSVARFDVPIHLGLDVHKNSITVGVLEPAADTPVLHRIGPDGDAVRRLVGQLGDPHRLKACYEAGPTGFTLARALRAWGVDCDVVAPSLIPRPSGDRVKTDRRDAMSLAMLHRAGVLTPVHVPDPVIEAVRDLARARTDLDDDLRRARRRMLAFLLRRDRVFRDGSTWTAKHHQWLGVQRFPARADQLTFDHYLAVITVREQQLAAVCADLRGWLDVPPLNTAARRLAAYHAIGYLGALSIAAEVGGDWTRFARARGFMAFTGLVPSEWSTGDKHHRHGITKTGNKVIRTQLVESAWHYRSRPVAGPTLLERRSHVSPATVARAVNAHKRLATRYRRLAARGKEPNVINTAIARELAGFVWAEMTATD